jgi:hypothetical protein
MDRGPSLLRLTSTPLKESQLNLGVAYAER